MRARIIALMAALLLAATAAPAVAAGSMDRSPVVDIADGQQTGMSVMKRSAEGIRARLATAGLVPGDAYTVWAVVFNNPAGL